MGSKSGKEKAHPVSEIRTWEPIRDPVYDYIEYNEELEEKIINTPYLQRLRRLHQIQVARLVYPGGEHSRFQHSLGVMHLAGEFTKSILDRYTGELDKPREVLIQAIRIAGLLHDIGHGPYSHAFDEAIIENNERLQRCGIRSHEDISNLIIEKSEIGVELERYELKDYVLALIHRDPALKPYEKALSSIIRGCIYPADILDFLVRDSFFTGARELGQVDISRLIKASYLHQGDIALEERAVGTLKAYLFARFQMFEYVYYHRMSRATDKIIQEILELADAPLKLTTRVEKCANGDFHDFLELDDYSLLYMIKEAAKRKRGSQELAKANRLVDAFLNRNIPWRVVGERLFSLDDPLVTTFYKVGVEPMSKAVENIFREKIKVAIGEEESKMPAWVDHTFHKFMPDNLYELLGEVKIYDRRTGKVKEEQLKELLLETPPKYPIAVGKFRIYVEDVYLEKYRDTLKELAEQAFEEAVTAQVGFTM